MTTYTRYMIVADAVGTRADGEWLKYPLVHWSLERGQQEVDRLNAEVMEAEESGYVYPFSGYRLEPVSDALVAHWDERIERSRPGQPVEVSERGRGNLPG